MRYVDALDAPDQHTPVRSIVDGRPWHAACANGEGEPARVVRIKARPLDCHGCGSEL